ncbi:MAG TPA: hypothetical protein VE862_12485 [Candidatus Acidoferrum sp.]|nr:hypothetical protein [Candidatus Acidoferrum sp.]
MIKGRKVITLCGSRKFQDDFKRINEQLTLKGNIVISLGVFSTEVDDSQKAMLDEIHKCKIDLSDAIYVVNRDGYIGKSTTSEIAYAKSLGKEVTYFQNPSSSP